MGNGGEGMGGGEEGWASGSWLRECQTSGDAEFKFAGKMGTENGSENGGVLQNVGVGSIFQKSVIFWFIYRCHS
jgi:hypothetical protein